MYRCYKKLGVPERHKDQDGSGQCGQSGLARGRDLENFNMLPRNGRLWGAKPHRHAGSQFLVYVGLDNQKPDYLGAEIEVALEDEKHVINVMIRLDKGDPAEVNPA